MSTPKLVAACLMLLIGGVLVVAISDSFVGRARDSARTSLSASNVVSGGVPIVTEGSTALDTISNSGAGGGFGGGGGEGEFGVAARASGGRFDSRHDASYLELSGTTAQDGYGSGADASYPSQSNQSPDQGGPSATRHVVRKANITIETDDVRAVFAKAALLVSEVQSEYVQDSSLTGSGKDAQAQLTLRVASDRLSTVLNQLRELGTVLAESSNGEDVTAQIVDLDARMRNEQRIEQELLELLGKRTDAPLKEVLELRDRIGQVRQAIETLHAQQQRLSRLVSLATILVIIRPIDQTEQEKPVEQSIGGYFRESISTSWIGALQRLADSLGTTLTIVVGGFIWWVIAIAAIVAARALIRSRLIVQTPAAT